MCILTSVAMGHAPIQSDMLFRAVLQAMPILSLISMAISKACSHGSDSVSPSLVTGQR